MIDLLIARAREIPLESPSGVYLLVAGDVVIYVGQSTNVYTRVARHARSFVEFDRAFWFEVPKGQLLAYEGALIRYFKPRRNGAPGRKGPRLNRDAEILAALGLPLDRAAQAPTTQDTKHHWHRSALRSSRRAAALDLNTTEAA